MPSDINLTIDDLPVVVPQGKTIFDAASEIGIDIPVLCHEPKLEPVGVCRVCAVEVEGSRVPPAACIRKAEEGMVVRTNTERIERSRKTLVELLLADHPIPCQKHEKYGNCELELMASKMGVKASRFKSRAWEDGHDISSAVISVDHTACIMCDRCIRACDEIQVNLVIGRAGKGYSAHIAFDNDIPMGDSSCVSCGECMAYCPTGALIDKPILKEVIPKESPTKAIDSICPYCGVGCSLTYHVTDDKIVNVSGRASPVNHGRLCVKGRYGFDYAHHPTRLTTPLIRKEDYPKTIQTENPPENPIDAFREATWDEAMALSASKFMEIKNNIGPQALAGFGSAKCSNEDNFLFQKLIRAVFGTNNVDHCTRLCHASSVAALMETIGSGAVSNVFADVRYADVAVVIGANPTENHPVAATFMKQAVLKGTKLIVIDPRRPPLAQNADYYVRFNPGTDVALLNGMMNVIISQGLHDEEFIDRRTVGFSKLKETVKDYTPEVAEKITGVPKDVIVGVARYYGKAKNAMIFWGMGISQHTTGTDNARSLVSLALLTGNIGRPGTGLHPLRGQNNVQGASDVGLIPMVYPGYQKVDDPSVRNRFEDVWGVPLDPDPGLTVVEIMTAALDGKIKGMFIMGENPLLSDPNTNKVKKCLSSLEFLVVQDIFLTETAEFADVVLPATSFAEKDGTYTNTDRRVQRGRKAVNPPGGAREDWKILAELSTRMGYPMEYDSPEEIFAEIKRVTPSYGGLTYERIEKEGLLWPCPDEDHAGTSVLFADTFPSGKGKFVPAQFALPKELPDEEYPYVLNTGRVLQHWHTGTMTRRSRALDQMSPEPFVEMHPLDMERLGVADGQFVKVSSRRGEITLKTRHSPKVSKSNVFIPFHFKEAAANVLTIDELDPYAKIPEFKFCAVKIEKILDSKQ